MSWGAPLGFSSGKSPLERIVAARHGEPGWYCRFRPTPTLEFPFRARLKTPCATARFDSAEDARLYVDHPGEIALLASRYLRWVEDGIDPAGQEGENDEDPVRSD